MATGSSTRTIVKGLMVSFDIFDRQEIERVNKKVTKVLELEPSIEEVSSHQTEDIRRAYVVYHTVWKIASPSTIFKTLSSICNEKEPTYNMDLLERYVEVFQVEGYGIPSLLAYVLVASFSLRKDALNTSEDIRDDLLRLAFPLRLFIDSFDGLTRYKAPTSPRATVITEIRMKLSKQNLGEIVDNERALVKQYNHIAETYEQRKELSEALKQLEPLDLSPPIGDVHSHILNGDNFLAILGCMHPVLFGDLRTPYIVELSYDESLLQGSPLMAPEMLMSLPVRDMSCIIWQGQSFLVNLISLLIYQSYIAFKVAQLDSQVAVLRESVSPESSKLTIDQVYKHLSDLSNYGARISLLLGTLGALERYWGRVLRQISERKGIGVQEIPVLPTDPMRYLGYSNFLEKLNRKGGYLETLSKQVLHGSESNKETLAEQKAEIAALRLHISDIVNLKTSKVNLLMSKTIERLTWVTVFLSILLTIYAIAPELRIGERVAVVLLIFFAFLIYSCRRKCKKLLLQFTRHGHDLRRIKPTSKTEKTLVNDKSCVRVMWFSIFVLNLCLVTISPLFWFPSIMSLVCMLILPTHF